MVKGAKVDFTLPPSDPWKTEWDSLSGTTEDLEARQMDARGWYHRNPEYWEEEEALEAPVNMVGGIVKMMRTCPKRVCWHETHRQGSW